MLDKLRALPSRLLNILMYSFAATTVATLAAVLFFYSGMSLAAVPASFWFAITLYSISLALFLFTNTLLPLQSTARPFRSSLVLVWLVLTLFLVLLPLLNIVISGLASYNLVSFVTYIALSVFLYARLRSLKVR